MFAIALKVRTLFWTAFYRLLGRFGFEAMGSGCIFEGWIDIPQFGGRITLGNGVRVCRNVELSVPRGGRLTLEDNVLISRGVILSAHQHIVVGAGAMIAEYAVVHDNNHVFGDRTAMIQQQGMVAQEVVIGQDVWIAAHAVVLAGARIPEGVVVGAAAVITARTKMEPFAVMAGVPARKVGIR